MKVQDLIDALSKYNPQQQVLFGCAIENLRSTSCCLYNGCLDIFEQDNQDVVEQLEDLEEPLDEDVVEIVQTNKKLVVINISGEENYYE